MLVPQVAARLREKYRESGDTELLALADCLRRRRPTRKAPVRSRRMTDELREEIRAYALDHPELPQSEVAHRFRVNPGRVSEALRGFRT